MTAANRFTTKALFAHAWDLEHPGAEPLLRWMRDAGLDTLCLAATYHSGWFVHPHHPTHRLFWSEGGAWYFHPRDALYHGTRLRPPAAASTATDWVAAAAEAARAHGIRLVSWTTGMHNTRLGLAHPDLTQRNVYGDSLPHALSIGHPEVRTYLKALCRDLAIHYPFHALQLETFGWLGSRHGHHHERDLAGLSDFERELLALCFNPATESRALELGIDVDAARAAVRRTLDAAFEAAPARPAGYPASMAELEAAAPALAEYNRFRQSLADELIGEIKRESLAGTPCRLYVQTPFREAIADACDGFAVWVYGMAPQKAFDAVRQGRAGFPPASAAEYHCYVRLGMGVPESAAQLREILAAAREGGATGVYLYNYSEAPAAMLGWIRPALEGM